MGFNRPKCLWRLIGINVYGDSQYFFNYVFLEVFPFHQAFNFIIFEITYFILSDLYYLYCWAFQFLSSTIHKRKNNLFAGHLNEPMIPSHITLMTSLFYTQTKVLHHQSCRKQYCFLMPKVTVVSNRKRARLWLTMT